MAESAAQRVARLTAARKAAMGRATGGVREDAAVEKAVASSPAPATPTTNDDKYMDNGQSVQDAVHTTHRNRPPKQPGTISSATSKTQPKQPGSNKVYTKHVVFALVSAIVIQLVALNKSLPKG